MKKLFLFAFFLISSSQALASFKSECIVTGRVASDVEKRTYFSDGKEKIKYLIFRLKVESAVGAGSSGTKWCANVFSKKKNRTGTVKIKIDHPQNEIVIPPIGEAASYLWSYFESEFLSLEEFSPYVEPAQTTDNANPSGV